MPNQWEELAKGFINAGGTVGNAFIEKGIKNDAEEMNRKGRQFLQDQTAKLNEWNMNLLANANKDDEVITQRKNVSTPYEQSTQDSYGKIFQDTQMKVNEYITKLANNKYGKTYAEGLDNLYKSMFGKPEYKIFDTKEGLMAVNPSTLKSQMIREYEKKKPVWKIVPTSKTFAFEKDGKYYLTALKQNDEGTMKTFTDELQKDEFEAWKKYNPDFETKEDIKQEHKVAFKIQFPPIGRRRSGNKKGKTEDSEFDVYGEMNSIWKEINGRYQRGEITSEEAQRLIQEAYLSYESDLEKEDIKEAQRWFRNQGIDIDQIKKLRK